MSRKSPDRRAPCGSSVANPRSYFGGCTSQYQSSSVVKIKRNTTKMLNYAVDPDPVWLDPFPVAEAYSAPDCSEYNSGWPFFFQCGDGINGNVWCLPDLTDDKITGTGTSFPVGTHLNYYEQTEETASGVKCRYLGFKNVYASKMWQGRWSYTSRMNGQADYKDWCCGDSCAYHNYDGTADGTKYLAVSANSSISITVNNYCSVCCGCTDCTGDCGTYFCGESEQTDVCCNYVVAGVQEYAASAAGSTHVDTFGNTYCDSHTSSSSCPGTSYGCTSCAPPSECPGSSTSTPIDPDSQAACRAAYAHEADGYLSEANGNVSSIVSNFCAQIEIGVPDEIDGDGTSWTIKYYGDPYTCFDGCGNVTGEHSWVRKVVTVNLAGGTYSVQQFALLSGDQLHQATCTSDGYCPTVHMVFSETISWSTTAYQRSTFSFYDSRGLESPKTVTVNGSLASPYTSAQVYNSVVSLLGTWDFGDEKVYPWREDSAVTRGPWVCYDEGGASPTVPCDENVILYSGVIKGAPAPEGIDRVWSFDHANYCVCESSVQPGCYAFYIHDYGAWSTDCGVPRATQWLNNFQSNNIPQGAFTMTGQFWTFPSTCNSNGPSRMADDTVWACKYAEIIFPKQSYNYFRPCGEDRFQVSASHERCVVSATDSVLTLEPLGPPTTINTNDKVWVCGVGGVEDGAYVAQRDSDYQITLKSGIVSASMLPSVPVANCGTGMITKLRFPNMERHICGRVDIVSATSTAPVTCSLKEPTYLVNDDTVWVTGATGMNINHPYKVIVLDPSNIVLSGSSGISQSYTGGGAMMSPFTPDWKWNNTDPLNNFSILKWKYNFRDVGEWQRVSASVAWNLGLCDCDVTLPPDYTCNPCPGPAVPAEPRPYFNACGMGQYVEEMTCDTHCLPFNACQPVAAYFSPNVSESFVKSGSSVGSAENFGFVFAGADAQYGTLWQGAVKQTMKDPLGPTQPCPCEAIVDENTMETVYECNCSTAQDSGDCLPDQEYIPMIQGCIKYYPNFNDFEAECSIPAGAPQLPEGIHIGCITSAQITSATCPQGNICGAPYAPNGFDNGETCNTYKVYPWATPWITLLAKEQCVCSQGRWAANYARNAIACQTSVPAP